MFTLAISLFHRSFENILNEKYLIFCFFLLELAFNVYIFQVATDFEPGKEAFTRQLV